MEFKDVRDAALKSVTVDGRTRAGRLYKAQIARCREAIHDAERRLFEDLSFAPIPGRMLGQSLITQITKPR